MVALLATLLASGAHAATATCTATAACSPNAAWCARCSDRSGAHWPKSATASTA